MNRDRLLERFLRYVRVDTTAREGVDAYPSSAGQWDLGRIVLGELKAMGLADAAQDEFAIVIATLPANGGQATAGGGSRPVIAFNAHFDTSPETTGANVRPQVIANYDGRDLVLPGDPRQVLLAASNPELAAATGKTVITTDGTTLLGGDDKAGMAVIMELIEQLVEHPELPRPTIKVCFTCDEEIGAASIMWILPNSERRFATRLMAECGRARRRNFFRRSGDGGGPRREHPSVDGQAANGQRDPCGSPFRRPASARNASTGSDGGPRGVRASVSCRWRSG